MNLGQRVAGLAQAEWIECPRWGCGGIRRLERGEPDKCASCGWLFAAGETEMALEAAREWEIVRAIQELGSAAKREAN